MRASTYSLVPGVLAVLGFMACGSEPVDPIDELARCIQVRDDWQTLLDSLDRSCTVPSDCAVIGTPYSNCDDSGPTLGACEGDAVAEAGLALRQDEIDLLMYQWIGCTDPAFSGQLGGSTDCDQGRLECYAGSCYAISSCLAGVCNPVAQTGCFTDYKCTWLRIDSANDVGTLDCVESGPVPEGGACTYGPDGEDTGYDDCVAGTICIGGVCEAICTGSPDSCTAPAACVSHAGIFPDTSNYGTCELP